MLRIASVFFALCALSLSAQARALHEEVPVIAVLYFDYQGKNEELVPLQKGLASMLISDLSFGDSYRVVERERLQDVLNELKLQASARIDRASAVKAGKLLGARYLVLGGYFDVLAKLRIDARIVDVETGKILQSAGAMGAPDDFSSLEQKLAKELDAHLVALLHTREQTPRAPRRTAKVGKHKKLRKVDAGLEAPAATLEPPRKKQPRAPKQLAAETAVEYGRALSALDRHDVEAAKGHLERVVEKAPDFELASLDLNRLMK